MHILTYSHTYVCTYVHGKGINTHFKLLCYHGQSRWVEVGSCQDFIQLSFLQAKYSVRTYQRVGDQAGGNQYTCTSSHAHIPQRYVHKDSPSSPVCLPMLPVFFRARCSSDHSSAVLPGWPLQIYRINCHVLSQSRGWIDTHRVHLYSHVCSYENTDEKR